MHVEYLTKVIIGPIISEKAALVHKNNNQVILKVLPIANKLEIRHAVEILFNVKVLEVTTANIKGKSKRVGGILGKCRNWKKAYVTLANGYDINFLGELS